MTRIMVELEVVSLPAAALRKGISRQAMWDAVRAGRINAIQEAGDWMVYLDSKFEALKPNAFRGDGRRKGG